MSEDAVAVSVKIDAVSEEPVAMPEEPKAVKPFETKTSWTDLTLELDDGCLYVGKLFLMMVSPVFRTMFESDFKEKDASLIRLKGKYCKDILDFLLCLHPEWENPVTMENVMQLYQLAHEYQCRKLLAKCVTTMENAVGNLYLTGGKSAARAVAGVDRILKCLNLCEIYDVPTLKNSIFSKLSTLPSCTYRNLSEFVDLSIETRHLMYEMRLKKLND